MIEDLLPFIFMVGAMVIMIGIWVFMTVRRALLPREQDYYNDPQPSGYDYSSAEQSAGKGGGAQG